MDRKEYAEIARAHIAGEALAQSQNPTGEWADLSAIRKWDYEYDTLDPIRLVPLRPSPEWLGKHNVRVVRCDVPHFHELYVDPDGLWSQPPLSKTRQCRAALETYGGLRWIVESVESAPRPVPWTLETFPKDRPVWVGRGDPDDDGRFATPTEFGVGGVELCWGSVDVEFVTWSELVQRKQPDGSPCGVAQ